MTSFDVHSVEELAEVAEWFVAAYPDPLVVVFEGGMGAGKTTLIRALCAQLGANAMSSPTFALVNAYTGHDLRPLYHFDLYRLEHTHQALDIGFEEYLRQDAYVFIEWPAVVLPLLQNYLEVVIEDHMSHRSIAFRPISR